MAISGLALLFLTLFVYTTTAQDVSLTAIRSLSNYQPSKVTLACSTSSTNRTVEFYRRVGSNVDRVTGNIMALSTVVELNFDLTPEREGYYYCQVGDAKSANEVELVAYPTVDPMVNAHTTYPTSPGRDVILHCPYKRGVLQNRYSVIWSRGLSPIDLETPEFSRHRILDDFSLMINSTVPDDAKAYSCQVEVTINDVVIRKHGPAVSLEVTNPIRITQSIADIAVLPGQNAVFTCTAVGVPQPQIKWLIGSTEVQGDSNPVVTSTLDSITVESTLMMTSVEETQTGPVSCVAYHSYGGEVFLATSTANLVVLTNNFDVTLTSETNGNVRLQATLPAVIPGVFSLVVRFIFNIAIVQEKEIIHPSFKNTQTIDISIPEEQLPQFRQFGVRVALKFDDVKGLLTTESEKITLPTLSPQKITGGDCECPLFTNSPDPASAGNSTVYILISIFIVLVVVLLIVGGVLLGICVHYMYRKDPKRSTTDGPVCYHDNESIKTDGSFGTLTRSVSRSSYNSDYSRSSGRSRGSSQSARSSRSSRSSHSSRGSSHGGSRAWSQGTLESVKEGSSTLHKDLAQWGAVEKELVSSPVSPDVGPPPLSPHEEAQYQPPQSREEVFHTSLPHATNPTSFTIKYEKTKLRHSDSSFEDMELNDPSFPEAPFKTK